MKQALRGLKTVFMCSNPLGAFDKGVVNLGRRFAMDLNLMQQILRFCLIPTDVESSMNQKGTGGLISKSTRWWTSWAVSYLFQHHYIMNLSFETLTHRTVPSAGELILSAQGQVQSPYGVGSDGYNRLLVELVPAFIYFPRNIILKWIVQKQCMRVHVARDKNQWWDVVNKVINVWFLLLKKDLLLAFCCIISRGAAYPKRVALF